MQRTRNKKRKGFSLVELVVVMAIIGILLVVMAPNYKGFVENAKTIGVRSDARTLKTMIDLVDASHPIGDTDTITEISQKSLSGIEFTNLKGFIADLENGSKELLPLTVAQLDDVIRTGTIPSQP